MKTPLPESVTNPKPTPEQEKSLARLAQLKSDKETARELCRAARDGDIWLMKKIYDSGFTNMNAHVGDFFGHYAGMTPLEMAVRTKNKDSVLFLIGHGAATRPYCSADAVWGPFERTCQGNGYAGVHKGALNIALEEKSWDMVQLLVENGARFNEDHMLAVLKQGQKDIAALIRDSFPDALAPFTIERMKAAAGNMDISDIVRDRVRPSPAATTLLALTAAAHKEPFLPPPPLPETPWKKIGEMEIVHVSVQKELGKKITDIFNFNSRERTYIVDDLETKSTYVLHEAFNQMANRQWLEAACDHFSAQGGKIDKNEVMTRGMVQRNKQKLT